MSARSTSTTLDEGMVSRGGTCTKPMTGRSGEERREAVRRAA